MVQFLNGTDMAFPEKYWSDFSPPDSRDSPTLLSPPPSWPDSQYRHQLHRKKSGKSRLQIVTMTGDNEADDEMSPRPMAMGHGLVRSPPPTNNNNDNTNNSNSNSNASLVSSCVGIFSHSTPIKCLVTRVMGCSPAMSHKICVDDSSVTVLHHSWRGGWQIKRLNDTSHLRLL